MKVQEVETWTFAPGREAPFLDGLATWFDYVKQHPALFGEWLSGACAREIDADGSLTGRFRMTFTYESLADLNRYRARRAIPSPAYEEYVRLDVGDIHIEPERLAVAYWEEVQSGTWRVPDASAASEQHR